MTTIKTTADKTTTAKPRKNKTNTPKPSTRKNNTSKYSRKSPKGSKSYQKRKATQKPSTTKYLLNLLSKALKKQKTSRKKPTLIKRFSDFLLFYFALVGFVATIGGVAETADYSLKQVINLKTTAIELVLGDR